MRNAGKVTTLMGKWSWRGSKAEPFVESVDAGDELERELRQAREAIDQLEGRADPTAPSYYRERQRAVRIELIPGDVGTRPFRSMRKLADYRIAEQAGVRCPDVLGIWAHPQLIDWGSLSGDLVLKPVRGAGSRGVRMLSVSPDRIADVWQGKDTTAAEITDQHQRDFDRGGVPMACFVERLVRDPVHGGPSDDWKALVLGERIGLWRQIRRDAQGQAAGVRYWGPAFEDLGEVREQPDIPLDMTMQPPAFAKELCQAATDLAGVWRRPLLRLDFFLDEHGPVFGETTPNPGGDGRYTPELDHHLGVLVEQAVVDLGLH